MSRYKCYFCGKHTDELREAWSPDGFLCFICKKCKKEGKGR